MESGPPSVRPLGREGDLDMGPLPRLYRLLIAALVMALSLGAGVWLAGYLRLPLGCIGVGLGAGCLLAWLLTRDFHHHEERPVRVQRRR
jgi:hypothetical protein